MYDDKYLSKVRYNEDIPLRIPKGFKFKEEPFRHQVVTFMYALHLKDLAILSTMGTGKTYCAINIARYWIQQGEAKKVLVVCPTAVLTNWRDEVHMFSNRKAVVLHDPIREKRLKMFKEKADFYIINFEATIRFMKQLLKLDPDIIIFDESSRIANPEAKQTKACIKLASNTKYRYILNGTPIANVPINLWSQFYVLDFGESLFPSFNRYRAQYFGHFTMKVGRRYFRKYSIRNKIAMEEVAERISHRSIRYTKEECIKDMPEKTYQTRTINLSKSGRKLYDEMMEHARLELTQLDQNITAEIMLTKFIKALQVTSGYIKTDEGNYVQMKHNPKMEELKSIIEEVVPESAMVIWCKYLHTIKMVQDMLDKMKLDYLTIKGEVEDKSAVAKIFQESSIEEIPIMICQIRSGGVGINLHKASYAVFLENEWRLQDRYQAEDRIHRIGQKNICTYIDIVINNSIDQQVLESIRKNNHIAEYILQRI
jgi:SNF2 family DNA or RNA helicase